MGHNRLGSLPRTLKWRQVIELIGADSANANRVAAITADAADERFREAGNDPAVAYCVWVLARLVVAARAPNFVQAINGLGITAQPNSTVPELVSLIGEHVRREQAGLPWQGHFGDFAALALRTALTETIATQGRTLFGSTSEDVHRAFQAYSSSTRFGELARRFFADFTSRALQSFVDRELRRHIGTDAVPTVSSSTAFLEALNTHSWQASVIVQRFAGDWHSKSNWESRGEISREEVQRFVGQSLRKLRSELRAGARQ
jgi:hypothetical protein